MRRNAWHEVREGETVTLSRVLPVRWDIDVTIRLADARRRRIATQVRQDLWRALRRQRGFAPVVAVTRRDAGLDVRAGGRVASAFDRDLLESRVRSVLDSPRNRARWLRFASISEQCDAAFLRDRRDSGRAGEGVQ